MPIVDKLPALLREELENAFEDDLDSIFDITNLRQSLDQKKRSTEIELRRVKPNLNPETLQENFFSIYMMKYETTICYSNYCMFMFWTDKENKREIQSHEREA